MHVRLCKVNNIEDIDNSILKNRAKIGGKAKFTLHYVVKADKQTIAFLAIDPFPHPQPFTIYEIFVLREFRGRGIGSFLLKEAENIARRLDYSIIQLQARSLDPEANSIDLIDWYKEHGYIMSSEIDEILTKRIK
jgi:ribosomal protein S18 acetylase RimI-like enzyme